MSETESDRRLLAAIENGLPLVSHPYAAVAAAAGMEEDEVIARLSRLAEQSVIRRLGLIVRHHELGYRANAMTVWDAPDDAADEAGRLLADLSFVTLCYRRRRQPPDWPYNLFCMIHGCDRETVLDQVERATVAAGLGSAPRDILFSDRRFKQRGARYGAVPTAAAEMTVRVG